MKRRGVLLAVTAVALGALAAPSAASAADLPPAPNLVADPAEADRDLVRWLSVHDPRATVRSQARSVLLSNGATAFLTSGYAAAVDRAAQTRVRQLDYANRMAATHPAQSYPWVNAAARRAANGTDAELAAFSSTGYTTALEKDNTTIPYDDGAALVTESDRAFVDRLALIDLGPEVRDRAAAVETAAEVAEFARYGLLSAAGIDADTWRAQYVADEWDRWREARQSTLLAVDVDRAAREGAASASVAVRAWQDVRTRFVRQPALWTERERFARARVDAWTRILPVGASTGPLWAPFTAQGPAVRTQWISEFTGAAEQTIWWTDLIQYAVAAADEWITGSRSPAADRAAPTR